MTEVKFEVPTREQVSPANQEIFDNLQKNVGFVPNVYATYGKSEHGLGRYLAFSSGKTSLNTKQKEAVNLVVSQVNGCRYCQAAHTVIGKMNGFSDDEIVKIRLGAAPFDERIDALVKLSKSIVMNHGKPDTGALTNFFDAGFTEANLVDLILVIGERITTNYLNKTFGIPVDFPEAVELESQSLKLWK
jgi:AhpD family alkylhydroperoxidase